MKTWLLIPDLHFPYQCKLYTRLMTRVITKVKPYGIIQLGDAVDCHQISKYPKDPERMNTVFDDLQDYKYQMDEWADLCRGPYWQLEGNHEARLAKFIWTKAPEINKMVRTIPELLGLRANLGLKWFPLSQWGACRVADTVLHHGVFYSKHVAVSGLDRYPHSFICGHTHRVQFASNGDRFHATLGHGSDEKLTAHNYTPTGWQQAFGLLHEIGGKAHLEIMLVKDGHAIIHGERI